MRLSHKLTLLFSLFGLAIAGGFQSTHIRTLRRETYAQARERAEATAAAVSALIEDDARSGNFSRLGPHLERMIRQTGVATVVVKDREGRRLIGRSDSGALISREPQPDVPIERAVGGVYDVETIVELGRRAGGKGVVYVGFYTDEIESRLREIGGNAVRRGAMAFLAISLFAWLLGTWLGLRLERLVPRIEALPRDPESFRPLKVLDPNDELGRLAGAFNRLGETLKDERSRRRQLEREKEELSAMLVHDLKTPLTVIRSGITLLSEQLHENGHAPERRRNGRGAAQKRTLELLELSTSRLHRMVEDVLQLARLEEVPGLRERAPVDLGALLAACAKDFQLVTAEREQRVVVRAPRSGLPRVAGDGTLLRRVLDNLVHNAVEHTPAGGAITLSAAARAGRVRVSVSDSGPGVPPEARADLFRKFFQKEVKRHVGNVGLGLAFCEKAVLRHEGVIGVEDAKPKGACFFFELPALQPELL